MPSSARDSPSITRRALADDCSRAEPPLLAMYERPEPSDISTSEEYPSGYFRKRPETCRTRSSQGFRLSGTFVASGPVNVCGDSCEKSGDLSSSADCTA